MNTYENHGCRSKTLSISGALLLSLLMIMTLTHAEKSSQAEEGNILPLRKQRGLSTASSLATHLPRKNPIHVDSMPAHLRRTRLDGSGPLRNRNLYNLGEVRGSWPLDEGSGQLVYDKTKNKNHGFLGEVAGPDDNDPTWKTSGGRTFLSFDGNNDFVLIPDSRSLEPPTVGVQAWVKGGPQDRVNKYIIGKGSDGGCASYALYTEAGTDGAPGMTFYISNGDCGGGGTFFPTPGSEVTNEASVWNDEWQQVVGFFDGSCVAIYVNGVFGSAAAADGPIDYNKPSTNDLYLGNFGTDFDTGDFAYDGYLDDVQIGTSQPLAIAKGPQVARVGTKVSFDGSHSFLAMEYLWDFGYNRISSAKKPVHVFKKAGIYKVCLTINANVGVPEVCENLVVQDTHCMQVMVYDPNERRGISGQGKIYSPVGAYKDGKALDGYASFTFNAPNGQLQFNFQRGKLNFVSKSQAWYIVDRKQGVLQGTGHLQNPYGKKATKFRIFITSAPEKTFRILIEELGDNKKNIYDSGVQEIVYGGYIQINSYE